MLLLSQWCHPEPSPRVHELADDESVAEKHGLNGKFNVLFAGNDSGVSGLREAPDNGGGRRRCRNCTLDIVVDTYDRLPGEICCR